MEVESLLEEINEDEDAEKIFHEVSSQDIVEFFINAHNIFNNCMDAEIKKYNPSTSFSEDNTRNYLNQIGDIPLLSEKEEKYVAYNIEIGKNPSYYNLLTERNLKLVASIAKKYINTEFELLDMIEEGNTGLIKAVSRYDVLTGNKFSTYASWWIRQAIQRGIGNNSGNIRIPIHTQERIKKVKSLENKFINEYGYHPSEEELSYYVMSYVREEDKKNYTKEKIRHYKKMVYEIDNAVSINKPIGEEDDSEMMDFIVSEEHNVEEEAIQNVTKDELNMLLDQVLDVRSKLIIQKRYGLIDGNPCTLQEIADEIGVTKERIRQIETVAIKRLKRRANKVGLKSVTNKKDNKYENAFSESEFNLIAKTYEVENDEIIKLYEISNSNIIFRALDRSPKRDVFLSFIGSYDFSQKISGKTLNKIIEEKRIFNKSR